jgi:uncharacterized membrane protein
MGRILADAAAIVRANNAPEVVLSLSCWVMIISAVFIFAFTMFIKAPYGRYSGETKNNKYWGPMIEGRLAWILMECPNIFIVGGMLYYAYYVKGITVALPNWLLLGKFLLHYIQRSVLYPMKMTSGQGSPMPVSVMMMGNLYVSWNAFTQALALIFVVKYRFVIIICDTHTMCNANQITCSVQNTATTGCLMTVISLDPLYFMLAFLEILPPTTRC